MSQIRVMVLLNDLTYLLAKPNNLPIFEPDQVRWFQSQFEYMLNFLVNSQITNELVDEIGDLAHEAEGLLSTIESPAPDINPLRLHVEEIRNRIDSLFHSWYGYEYERESNIKLKTEPIQVPSKHRLPRRKFSMICEDDEAVGLSKLRVRLSQRLLKGSPKLEAIAIIGEGGIGKTTLANIVYNGLVRRGFSSRAWITVSREYRLRNLLLDILNQVMVITQEFNNMDEWELRRQILKQLGDRRYLIVMDDVWTAKAWDELKDVLPDNNLKSRVVLTTQSSQVFERVCTYTGIWDLLKLENGDLLRLLDGMVDSGEVLTTPSSKGLETVSTNSDMWELLKFEKGDLLRLVDGLVDLRERVSSDPFKLEAIAIIGNCRNGKTALANLVYQDRCVRRGFSSRAWVKVSREYRLRNLLLDILNQVRVSTDQEMYDMDEWELRRQILKQLEGRRYLIVLDDVETGKAWDELEDVFPVNRCGSRILVTTVSHDVAARVTGGFYNYFQLGPLSLEESWELFCKVISGDEKYLCPDDLATVGRRIVEYCLGRPMAIVLAASILRVREKTHASWLSLFFQQRSYRSHQQWMSHPFFHKNQETNYNDPPQLGTLSACYEEMPQHLKTCFLYLSVFPEDFEISVKQLIQLWIAEGLIPWVVENATPAGLSMEDLADGYLKELVGLKLVQVTKKRSNGDPKSIRIHDSIQELCISLSWDEKFIEVYGHSGRIPLRRRLADDILGHPGGSTGRSTPHKPWVLSILNICREYVVSLTTCSNNFAHVRSFSCFSRDARSVSREEWASVLQNFPLLRVLNLGLEEDRKLPNEATQVRKLPSEATQHLSHLRYIKVSTGVTKSIFKLWNLQTIDLRTCRFDELPKDIWKMQQLRHLYIHGLSRLPKADENDDEDDRYLLNLQTLSCISVDPDDEISKAAPNLKKLGLYNCRCISEKEQESTFNLPQLQSLKFVEECTFQVSIKFPTTITKITVKNAHLKPNVIKMFEELPNLHILKLVQASFDDNQLVFGEDSFPQLQLLNFQTSNIGKWELKKGATPRLQRLFFGSCSELHELPTELWDGDTLQELEMIWPSTKLADKLATDFKARKKVKMFIYPPPSIYLR